MLENKEYPEILLDLADQIGSKLVKEQGMDVEAAANFGFEVAEHIRKHWGKHPVYIPVGTAYTLSLRDREIFERFGGHNHGELAREYDLTPVRIYQIVKHMRVKSFNERQRALF